MQTIFQLPQGFRQDLERFRHETERFQKGLLSAAEYRALRVPQGIYEQRESGTYMLRVRFPAGAVLPEQMRTLAAVARRYGQGVLHVTTRQDIQVHRVLLDDICPALAELAAAGLTTKGGGGNTVRNITACPDAGVCAREAFDVSPHVVALTEFLIPDPLSYQLPRKFKIACSGCPADCAGATVNDVGFVARRNNGTLGFAAYVGGGMGASSRVADRLEDFIPADQIHLVAESVKRVFDNRGNRRNRHKARLRFLIEQIGLEQFRELYQRELAALRPSAPPALATRPWDAARRGSGSGAATPSPRFTDWQARRLTRQKQPDYFIVEIPLALGDIDADRLERLADVVDRHGEGMARTTQRQNLALRWVHRDELVNVHRQLEPLRLAASEPAILGNLVACAGASTCRLGICLSRGLAEAIREALCAGIPDLDGLGDVKVNISGCPNACGRHPVADIGLFGAARRVDGRLVPHYVLQLGGCVGEGRTSLGGQDRTVPARNVPRLLADLLEAFGRSAECPDFAAFLEAEGQALVDALVEKYQHVPDFAEGKDYYYDWGAQEMFSLAGRGPGECGAGVFDLIEVDLASAREALAHDHLFEAVVLGARALLVTRGQQAQDAAQAVNLFRKHFLEEGLVDGALAPLLARAHSAAQFARPHEAFESSPQAARQFVDAVQKLYESMDDSLRFKPVDSQTQPQEAGPASFREADLRGVACPLNYVKTKMFLDKAPSGATVAVLLDEAGARNVPPSVEKDGHQVLGVTEENGHWRLLVRRA